MTFTPGDTGRTRDGLGEYAVKTLLPDKTMIVAVNHPSLTKARMALYLQSGLFLGTDHPDDPELSMAPLDLLPPTRSE